MSKKKVPLESEEESKEGQVNCDKHGWAPAVNFKYNEKPLRVYCFFCYADMPMDTGLIDHSSTI